MNFILSILLYQILPIFLLIGTGMLINRRYGLDVRTLSRLTVYALVPGFIFVTIYETGIPPELVKALIFSVVLLIPLGIASLLISRLASHGRPLSNATLNSMLFFNSGNFGLPLITLVFMNTPQASLALSTQVMVLLVQNLAGNTLGFYLAGQAQMHKDQLLKLILGIPAMYALAAALILKALPIDATTLFFWPTLVYLKGGLIPVALFTLGVQLSKSKFRVGNGIVWRAAALRLVISPVIAYGLLVLMQIDGTMAQVLLIGSGLPSAVTTALAAVEFDNEPEFASQTVMVTTVLCAVTLAVLIPVARWVFPG